jgi:hypothetical protein
MSVRLKSAIGRAVTLSDDQRSTSSDKLCSELRRTFESPSRRMTYSVINTKSL